MTSPPTQAQEDPFFALPGLVTHAAEWTAAPISAWPAGRAGVDLREALEAARRLAEAAP